MMVKIYALYKMLIQTLRELSPGYKAVIKKYPDKQWNLQSVKNICKRVVQQRRSATQWKPGSGRPRSARTADNIESVADLLCSQEDQPGTSKSKRSIANDLNIGERSVLYDELPSMTWHCECVPAQVINAATKQKRLERSKRLLRRISVAACKRVFFRHEKVTECGLLAENVYSLSKSAVDRESKVCTASCCLCRCVCKVRSACILFRK